jgi:hypothetical protein
MRISIVPYSEQHIPAVREFNQRLQAGGAPADYVFSESDIPAWLPRCAEATLYNEFYLALEEDRVRGAFVLKHQTFSFFGKLKQLIYLHHPLSEGVVDKRYSQVGAQMVMRIVAENPLLFALGMGGYERPLPRMLVALRWKNCLIPFYFRVCNAMKFLREMRALRSSATKRIGAEAAALTGLGPMAIKTWQAVRGWKGGAMASQSEIIPEFDDWADQIWTATAPDFAMIGVRDGKSLRTLYPSENGIFTRIRVSVQSQVVGWAVVGILHRPGHEQYGDLRVGTILDALARPEHATAVIAAATRVLTAQGADLIGSNQSHTAWTAALSENGFLSGPSNFIFAAAPAVSKLLEPFETAITRVHLNRGDGDNLLQYR